MTNTETTGAPAELPDLNDAIISRIAIAWGISPAEARAQYETAREAVAAEDEERQFIDGERAAYGRWAKTKSCVGPWPFDAWLARARIHRDYETSVDADIAERTANTSAEMDRVTRERDRAQAEVERLSKLVNDLDTKLQARATPAATTADHPPTGKITGLNLAVARAVFTDSVLREVAAERAIQFEKRGQQRHQLVARTPPARSAEVNGTYYIPTCDEAKRLCEEAFAGGYGSFGHILVEEVAEAINAPTLDEMRAELIQVAAVAVQMVEVIDIREVGKAHGNG